MNPYNFSVLCFSVCSFFVGILVWLKRPDQVGKLFFWHSVAISVWGIGVAFIVTPSASYLVTLWSIRISNGAAAFIPTIWFHFILALTGNLNKRKRLLGVLYFFAISILIISPTPWFIPSLRPILGFEHFTKAGPLYSFLTVLFFMTVPLGFYELIMKIRVSSQAEKKQLLGLLLISFAGYLGGSLTFIPVYDIPFPQYGLFLLPIYPFGLAYFITRTNIFDVEELAQAAHRDKLMAIGVLAASINHEVRNPLFVIKGQAESFLERQKEGILKDKDQIIEKAIDVTRRSMEQADRAMDIIKRLSIFAKSGIDSEIKFESVKISEVIEDILPFIRYELATHQIALTRDIPPNLPEVRADRRYLEEILFNLLVNASQAIKGAGKPGEIKIAAEIAKPSSGLAMTHSQPVIASEARQSPDLEKSPRPESGLAMTESSKQVIITISDTGPGIPQDKLEHVFRPFYTTKEEGTGLGLYITQQLIEKIGGRIKVESTVGVGTTFEVNLPCQRPGL